MSVIVDGKHINSLKKADEVIDQIFDEHEAQLKAKKSDLERQEMIIKCLNIDLDNKEKLLKAKNEEIEKLKAKDEKIGAVVKLCEEKITDWHAIESGQEKAYQAILSLLKDTK